MNKSVREGWAEGADCGLEGNDPIFTLAGRRFQDQLRRKSCRYKVFLKTNETSACNKTELERVVVEGLEFSSAAGVEVWDDSNTVYTRGPRRRGGYS